MNETGILNFFHKNYKNLKRWKKEEGGIRGEMSNV